MVQMNTPNGGLEMHNPRNKKIIRDNDLANLFGIKRWLQEREEFQFDINQAIYSFESKDITQTGKERELDNYTILLEEYKKILKMERFRRRLEMEIKRGDEMRTLKEELKKKRQQRRTASNPYLKNEKRKETEQ